MFDITLKIYKKSQNLLSIIKRVSKYVLSNKRNVNVFETKFQKKIVYF